MTSIRVDPDDGTPSLQNDGFSSITDAAKSSKAV
jgi:hypothetical protein